MYHITGDRTLNGKVSWQGGRDPTTGSQDGVTLRFNLGQYQMVTEAQNRHNHQSELEHFANVLAQNGITWVTLGMRTCNIDLDGLRSFFRGTPLLELDSMPWLTRRIELQPDVIVTETMPVSHFHPTFYTALEIVITPDNATLRPDVVAIVNDPDLAQILIGRLEECKRDIEAESYLSAIILLGSILEGLLLSKVVQNRPTVGGATSAPKDSTGKVVAFEDWTLEKLIQVTHECRWIGRDIRDFSAALRNYRNLIHPREQLKQGFHPDAGTCRISLEVVQAVIDDLSK